MLKLIKQSKRKTKRVLQTAREVDPADAGKITKLKTKLRSMKKFNKHEVGTIKDCTGTLVAKDNKVVLRGQMVSFQRM